MFKMFDRLTGAQITVIAVALIAALVPGSLYAVAAFTNVAIQDPVSGNRASVDSTGKLAVKPATIYRPYTEAYEYYAQNPAYKVTIGFTADTSKVIYTVPTGYYLYIESLTGVLSAPSGYTSAGFYLTSSIHGGITGVFAPTNPFALVHQTFGSGFVAYSGETISVDSRGVGNTGLYLHGHLLYANYSTYSAAQAVPPAPPLAATNVSAMTRSAQKSRESPP
ncbi:MAG TPA: hypothetical protein PKA55_08880 [Rhodoblastus sp.]|nr:hypothetical protein [Rhodoblastus sp.]